MRFLVFTSRFPFILPQPWISTRDEYRISYNAWVGCIAEFCDVESTSRTNCLLHRLSRETWKSGARYEFFYCNDYILRDSQSFSQNWKHVAATMSVSFIASRTCFLLSTLSFLCEIRCEFFYPILYFYPISRIISLVFVFQHIFRIYQTCHISIAHIRNKNINYAPFPRDPRRETTIYRNPL